MSADRESTKDLIARVTVLLKALTESGAASPEFRREWTQLRPLWREAKESGNEDNIRTVFGQIERMCNEESARRKEDK